MRIRVDEVNSTSGKIFIVCSTRFGAAVAVWQADIPRVGEEYDVELEIDGKFLWGSNASVSENYFSLSEQEDITVLSARLLSIDKDGVAVIEFDGAKAMIELAGPVPRPPFFIKLNVESLSVYPTYV